MSPVVILTSAGGLVTVTGAITFIGRGIFRQVAATDRNTDAMRDLSKQVQQLRTMMNGHETRLTVLEDRIKR
jgi:hypothetical protein